MQHDLVSTSNSVFDESNLGDGNALSGSPAPCAVCFVNRESILMIPAKMSCPDGWNKEYGGYLVSEASMVDTTERGDYKCLGQSTRSGRWWIGQWPSPIHGLPCWGHLRNAAVFRLWEWERADMCRLLKVIRRRWNAEEFSHDSPNWKAIVGLLS